MTAITCPRCGRTSHNPNDAAQRYCGWCHAFHDDMRAMEGFRVAAEGEWFTCADCGQRFLKYQGQWIEQKTAAELSEIARERDAKKPRH